MVQAKKTLGGLGLMAEDPFDRPNPFIDAPTTRGLRAFQRAKDLKEDGVTTPGGETERALRGAVNNLAKSFGPEWRAFQKRKAAAEQGPARKSTGLATALFKEKPDPRIAAPLSFPIAVG